MKRICYVVLGLLLVSLFSCAGSPAKNTAEPASSVWQISKGVNTIYLGK